MSKLDEALEEIADEAWKKIVEYIDDHDGAKAYDALMKAMKKARSLQG